MFVSNTSPPWMISPSTWCTLYKRMLSAAPETHLVKVENEVEFTDILKRTI